MSTDRWDQLERFLDEALALPPAERPAFIAAIEDEALRAEVASLLDHANSAPAYFERLGGIAAALMPTTPDPLEPDQTIGAYIVEEKLGSGGMGVVYRARDPRLGRRVALKLLPPHLSADPDATARLVREAQAASALDHPNLCTIYEVGEHDGGAEEPQVFIAMACYEGETLRDKIERGPLPLDEALAYAHQLAGGLARAHTHGIVHRDVKPANVFVTDDGLVKLLDFGIAKMAEGTEVLTRDGMTLGTVAYMSPEQTRGEAVDARTDQWAFGVLLYEMLTGRRPFRGATHSVTIHAIRHDDPGPVARVRSGVPAEVDTLLQRLLAKDPADRLASISAAEATLAALLTLPPEPATLRAFLRRPGLVAAGLAAVILLAGLVAVPAWRDAREARARALLPEIERLAAAGAYADAYALARRAERALGEAPALTRLWPLVADTLTVRTDPPGARVTVMRFDPEHAGAAGPAVLGETPLVDVPVARGSYHLRIEREGFAPVERIAARALFDPVIRVDQPLVAADRVPAGMVFVPGAPYQLRGWRQPTAAAVDLEAYAIDRYEVSNRGYKAFVDAGGYRNEAYWQHPFVRDGERLSWAAAMALLTDRTGLPGPRGWSSQTFPEGAGDLPVTGVTWYEAAAYAAWAGKRLPTLFEWQRAARPDTLHPYGVMMPWGFQLPAEPVAGRARFDAEGPAAVDRYPFGVSPHGAYNMAGNVKEWTLNRADDGYATAGGSWREPVYAFGYVGAFPGFYSSPTLGFRCARSADGMPLAADAPATQPLRTAPEPPTYTPVPRARFESFLSHYRYDPQPLGVRLIDVQERPDWTRETIVFAGANGDSIRAHLYLPTRAAPPYQTLVYAPPYPVYAGWQRMADNVEQMLAPHLTAGRAILAVVPASYRARLGPDLARPWTSVRYRNLATARAIELQRGVDYLATRDDIDLDRLAHLSLSASDEKLIYPAVDDRYRAVVLIAAGLRPRDVEKLPEVNPVNFVPYLDAPVLVLHGRYDEIDPLEHNTQPLMALLPEPKRLAVVDAGHVPPMEQRVPIINAWLDETLGPVRFE